MFLNPALYGIDVGINAGVSCLNFDYVSNTSTPLNFSFYPGVGHIPVELINPGNHTGLPVPWSVEIDDPNAQVETVTVSLMTESGPVPAPIDRLNDSQTESNVTQWYLDSAPQAGQIYKVNVSWIHRDHGEERTVDLYLAFNDCGFQMPLSCDPNRTDPCIVPGHECYFNRYNDIESWLCLKEGPREAGEDCSTYAFTCKGNLICHVTEAGSTCQSLCSLDESSSGACDELCNDYSVIEAASHRIGICN